MIQIPKEIHSVYFIGIAGIGMSAIARYFKAQGIQVAGYDLDHSALAQSLIDDGIPVHFTEKQSILDTAPDLVVYTPAVPATHQGLVHYRQLGIPVVKRAQVLGWISHRHQCIAVAGTHGKTTTSAMITWVLKNGGVDVTAFLGGLATDLGGNLVIGKDAWLVAEADEYDRSFHALSPEIAVVTAMDADHLDIYQDYEGMVDGYSGFLAKVHDNGTVIIHHEVMAKLTSENLKELHEREVRLITFGRTTDADYSVSDFHSEGKGVSFDVYRKDKMWMKAGVGMPGEHNALNACVALILCDVIGLDAEIAVNALKRFSGIKRRFEVVHAGEKMTIIDDYAHHPKELEAAIRAARLQYPGKKLTGVFQPHLYTRTRDFYTGFADALDLLDESILVELYPARELPIEGVNSKMIYDAQKSTSKHLTIKKELIGLLEKLKPEILLLLGAGDLDRMVPEIIKKLT